MVVLLASAIETGLNKSCFFLLQVEDRDFDPNDEGQDDDGQEGHEGQEGLEGQGVEGQAEDEDEEYMDDEAVEEIEDQVPFFKQN